jgi:hypothetical protein
MTLYDLVMAFGERYDVLFGRASHTQILAGAQAGVPKPLLDFLTPLEPRDPGTGSIRMLAIGQLVSGLSTVPAVAWLAHFGFFPFAITPAGDLYCIRPVPTQKIDAHPVVLFSHQVDYSTLPATELDKAGKIVAPTLEVFFQKALNGSIATTVGKA